MIKLTLKGKTTIWRKEFIMAKSEYFTGRKTELAALNRLMNKRVASLVVIKGRRRVGKSRLIEEFAKGKTFLQFSGLSPTSQTTAQSQRDEFALQLAQQTGIPEFKADDWSKLFFLLAERIKTGRVIVLLDEITWMGDKDTDFLGKLKNAWDLHFKKNSELILVLCGSISSWIEKNIINSTGFFGRISLKMTLEELTLPESNVLLNNLDFKKTALEKFILLSVMGGIPWYLEQINPLASAEENIRTLCFQKGGVLVDEYQHIFHNLFGKRGVIYRNIVELLAKNSQEYMEIALALDYFSGGPLSDYLDELVVSGFIKRDFTWNLKTGEESKLSRFRLSDNYLRFYLRYIKPRLNKIIKGQYDQGSIYALPGWSGLMGLQFENLVLNNRNLVQKKLGINPDDIVCDNPYFQHKTSKQKGCQIDYLIQTKQNTLYACEIKFSRDNIKQSIIEEVENKIDRLSLPRNFACVPVLIHANRLVDVVRDSRFFIKTIDFSELLQAEN